MIKNWYPIALIKETSTLFGKTCIYTKLDAWGAYTHSEWRMGINTSTLSGPDRNCLNPQWFNLERRIHQQIVKGILILQSERRWMTLHQHVWLTSWYIAILTRNMFTMTSVSNRSGPPGQVRVWVGTEPFPNMRSWSSINLNCLFGYGSMDRFQPGRIGPVVSGLSSRSVCSCI
jgi:hypothetical protein